MAAGGLRVDTDDLAELPGEEYQAPLVMTPTDGLVSLVTVPSKAQLSHQQLGQLVASIQQSG